MCIVCDIVVIVPACLSTQHLLAETFQPRSKMLLAALGGVHPRSSLQIRLGFLPICSPPGIRLEYMRYLASPATLCYCPACVGQWRAMLTEYASQNLSKGGGRGGVCYGSGLSCSACHVLNSACSTAWLSAFAWSLLAGYSYSTGCLLLS